MYYKPFTFLLVFFLSLSIFAEEEDTGFLTLEEIYKTRKFSAKYFDHVEWTEGGNSFLTLENSKTINASEDIVKYDLKSGKQGVLVSAEDLIPEGKNEALEIYDYSISEDGDKVLIFTNTKRVWRRNTRGDYWVFYMSNKKLIQLGKGLPESSLMFAKISPDGKNVAYVSKNNIYVENLSTYKIKQLTFDGSKTIINGTFDWAYEEEFYCRDGFRWSPDSKKIAYWQLDASGVRNFYMINNLDSLYSFIIPVQYPKAGETLSACKVGAISSEGGKTVWMKIEGDPRNNYIPRMEWAANSDELIIQQLNRHQNTNHVLISKTASGEVKEILTETDDAWLDPNSNMEWVKEGKYFIWQSERTGWRHIYMVSRDGKTIKPITNGEYEVIDLLHIDKQNEYIYFLASPDNATQRYLYRTNFDGTVPEKLSPNDIGAHRYNISPNSKYAIHRYSSIEKPPYIELIQLPSHKQVKVLVDNKELTEKISKLKKSPVEFFNIDISDSVSIDGYMMKPYNFNKSKKYPVLFTVYGEPLGQTTRNEWGGSSYLWYLMLTQKGYIVISIDTRGTDTPKGRSFRKACYLKMGVLNSYEHAMATKEIIKWPFTDPERVAIYGWSGGGSSTLNAMFRYPEIYNTGMAVAPVADISLYNAIYQEKFMRTPQEKPEEYKKSSPITYAKNLKGNLLIVHGTGDDNVHYQGTERLIDELIKYNKHFTMMSYPNRSHSIYERTNTTLHLRTLLTNYLLEHVRPGGI